MPAPKRLRFTKRKNGKNMCTVAMDLHLDEALVDMVAAQLGKTRAEAAAEIMRNVCVELSERLSYRTPIVQATATNTQFSICHTDSIDDIEAAATRGETITKMPDSAVDYIILSTAR